MMETFARVRELRRGNIRLRSIKEGATVALNLEGHGQISLNDLREGHSRKRKQPRREEQPEGVWKGWWVGSTVAQTRRETD